MNETVFDFVIFDLGTVSKQTVIALSNVNIPIVCSGDKPYEEKMVGIIEEYSTIFSFSQGESRNGIYYSNFGFKLFEAKINSQIFKDIMNDFIKKEVMNGVGKQ